MSLRFLHTSDWHLGATLGNAPRDDEHERFLGWLLETLRREKIDVLIIAGDIFHYAQPSAEAQRLYYRFLARAGVETPVRQVVVIAGNHDSPTRIDAPRDVLEVLRVQVIGGLQADPSSWDRCLCPIPGRDGRLEAVVVAVPFVHEFRLGLRTTGRPPVELINDFREAFAGLYRELADRATYRYPGVPLIATGHLTCLGVERGEYDAEIHQVGTIGGLPPEIFDPRYRYVALGHLHRMFRVGQSAAWYCGSPLAMNVREARSRRHVLRLELDLSQPDGPLVPVPLEVPAWRDILVLRDTPDEVIRQLRTLETDQPLPPYVYLELLVPRYMPEAGALIDQALATHPLEHRPRILSTRHIRITEAGEEEFAGRPPGENLQDLTPVEVFVKAFQSRFKHDPAPELLALYRTVVSQVQNNEPLEEVS